MNRGKWKVALSSLVSVRFQNRLPRLVIHEKYEKHVKWILRILTFIGIVSCLIVFSTWYFSLLVAVGLVLVEQFFEKAIFEYTTIFVQPLPGFKYDSNEWKGMGFAFPLHPNPKLLNVVGCAFVSEQYARDFFKMLKAWNYNAQEDKDNNICLSFIVEDEKDYSVYLYPNPKRKIVNAYFKKVEELQKFEKKGKEHQQLIMQWTFCKTFPFEGNSFIKQFIERQDEERPFWLQPFLYKEDGSYEIFHGEEPILKYHFKYKYRGLLEENEYEY